AQVEPGRQLRHRRARVAAVQDLAHDLLRPGRAGLAIGRNDHIALAELEFVPDRGIEVIALHFARLPWPRDGCAATAHDFPFKTDQTLRALAARGSVPRLCPAI